MLPVAGKPVGIGIVGLGNRGRYFARSWPHDPRSCIVACCERDAGVLKSARAEIGDDSINYYSDLERMLGDDNVDAVVVATHEQHHKECGIAVLRADKHLFLEKPMAQTIEDCDALILAWENTDKVFMVGLELRYCSLCRTMKHILDRGKIGEVKIGYAFDNVGVGATISMRCCSRPASAATITFTDRGDADKIRYRFSSRRECTPSIS